jgi:hypothetical protein
MRHPEAHPSVTYEQERLLRQLILEFVRAVADRGASLPKIKLVKLLYLVDLAAWETKGEIATGLDWMYYHYGPYARSLEPVLDRYEGQYFEVRQLSRQATSRAVAEASRLIHGQVPIENEVVYLFIPIPGLPDEAIEDSVVAGIAERLAQRWAAASTEEILRVVYETQPIARGTRYEPIDWNLQPRTVGVFGNRARSFALSGATRQSLDEAWAEWEATGHDRGRAYEPEAWLFDNLWLEFNERQRQEVEKELPAVRVARPRPRRLHLDD